MKGARSGPVKTVIENTVIANPRVLLSNISEKTAATTASGQAPKIPICVCQNSTPIEQMQIALTSPETAQQNRLQVFPRSNSNLENRETKH